MYKSETSFILDYNNENPNNTNIFKEADIEVLAKSRIIIEKTLKSKIEINGKETTLAEYYFRLTSSKTTNKNSQPLNHYLSKDNSDINLYNIDSVVEKIYFQLLPLIKVKTKDKDNAFSKIEIRNENQLFAKLFCNQLLYILDNYFTEISIKKDNNIVYPFQLEVDSLNFLINGIIIQNALITDNLFRLNNAMNKKSVELNNNLIFEKVYIENQIQMRQNSLNANFNRELSRKTNSIIILDESRLPLIKIKTSAFISILISSLSALFLSILGILIKSHC